jgi:hypothetical protein
VPQDADHSLTLSLATAFGLYMVAASIGAFLAPDRWLAILEDFRTRPALTYLAGLMAFGFGVAIILTHNIWSSLLAGLVSVVGWAAGIEGLIILARPEPLFDLAASMIKRPYVTGFMVFTPALGGLILAHGLTGTVI